MSKYAGAGESTQATVTEAVTKSRQGSRSKPGERKVVGFRIQISTNKEIERIAKVLGADKSALLERAWKEFTERNAPELAVATAEYLANLKADM